MDALVIWGARVDPSLAGTLKVTLVMTGVKSPYLLSGFGSTLPEIYNLEQQKQPEKPLNVDLDLYQINESK